MTRDTFDRFQTPDRGRFGDNEYASDQPEKLTGSARLHDFTLTLRQEKPLAIAVTDPNARQLTGTKWIWLPKSKIEFEKVSATSVKVTLPEWLAKEKGLV